MIHQYNQTTNCVQPATTLSFQYSLKYTPTQPQLTATTAKTNKFNHLQIILFSIVYSVNIIYVINVIIRPIVNNKSINKLKKEINKLKENKKSINN